jgi:PAS domain-containing protein
MHWAPGSSRSPSSATSCRSRVVTETLRYRKAPLEDSAIKRESGTNFECPVGWKEIGLQGQTSRRHRSLEAPVILRWIRRDGSVRWTEHRSAATFAAEGTLIALEGVAREVTPRVTGEERVPAADARLRDLLAGIDVGALVLDT